MAYIRKREKLLTGFQESRDWSPEIDLQVDFVMVYGIDSGMPERIRAYREKGYIVHVMAGSAWGPYQDFLNGEWDGISHWDESQTETAIQFCTVWIHPTLFQASLFPIISQTA